MTVTFQLTRDDVRAFARHHHGKRYWRNALRILGLITLINVALAYYNMPDKRAVAVPVALLFPWVVLPPLAALAKPGYLALMGWQCLRLGTPKDFVGTHEVTLSEDGYSAVSEASEGRARWSKLHGVERSASHIFFYSTPAIALAIPVRGFSNPDEAAAFYSFARQHWETASGASE